MKPTTTMQLCAYQRGYQAGKAGKDAKANPHRKNTVAGVWWRKGHEAAALSADVVDQSGGD